MSIKLPEAWQRGPVEGVPPLLQPIAHALVQAREEIFELLKGFPEELIWRQPAGVASVAFHLQHITGVLDRLFTYARGEMLNDQQLSNLKAEGLINSDLSIESLLTHLEKQVDECLQQLRETNESILTEPRGIGRKRIPTTVLGLLFHSAEHTMRHTGQLLVTARVLATTTTE